MVRWIVGDRSVFPSFGFGWSSAGNMIGLIIPLLALVAASTASYSGGAGVLVKGPSGVVTGHGPIGPTGPAHGDGFFYGAFGGFPGTGYGAAVIGPAAPPVLVAGPSAGGAYVAGPGAGFGHAFGGFGGFGGYAGGGYVGWGGHGVAVKGPRTVPVVVEGPAGKVAADGLYGVPHHHY